MHRDLIGLSGNRARNMKCVAVLAALVLAACGKSVPSDGVADVKFGMSSDDLKRTGFTCETERCSREPSRVAAKDDIPFNKPDTIRANLVKGVVTSIVLYFQLYSYDEIIAAYSKSYGDAYVCRFRNVSTATIEDHVWTAKNGATITVSKILDYGVLPNLGWGPSSGSAATYRDANETKAFRADRC